MSRRFTEREIVLFAMATIKQQLEAGLIDKKHVPQRYDEIVADCQETKELVARCLQEGVIPNEHDILNATRSFYADDDSFTEMFTVLCARGTTDPSVKKVLH